MHWREFNAYVLDAVQEAEELEEAREDTGEPGRAERRRERRTRFGKPPAERVLHALPNLD